MCAGAGGNAGGGRFLRSLEGGGRAGAQQDWKEGVRPDSGSLSVLFTVSLGYMGRGDVGSV